MGLSAAQARLLTITARKSDCEFQSMTLSHQKIALSRDMENVSTEYQDALDQTKLVYDYYGSGTSNMDLTYGLLMSPSTYNDYFPRLVTDAKNRIVLNSAYAQAAKIAGIPAEGLQGTPSSDVRNKFIEALNTTGVITAQTATNIESVTYANDLGIGATVSTTTETAQVSYKELLELIAAKTDSSVNYGVTLNTKTDQEASGGSFERFCVGDDGNGTQQQGSTASVSLYDLLNNTDRYNIAFSSKDGEKTPLAETAYLQQKIVGTSENDKNSILNWLTDQFTTVLGGTTNSNAALQYAYNAVYDLVYPSDEITQCANEISLSGKSTWDICEQTEQDDRSSFDNGDKTYLEHMQTVGTKLGPDIQGGDGDYLPEVVVNSANYLGFTFTSGTDSNSWFHKDRNDNTTVAINLNNIAKVFLTGYVEYMEGLDKSSYSYNVGKTTDSNLYDGNDDDFEFTVVTGTTTDTGDDNLYAKFYDTMFNQICTKGWTENDQIDDKDYMQEMMKSGMVYISSISDDGYYYQGNYSTDKYIKEVSDDEAIARAEAKYNTEKTKIENKEDSIDIKMKNLDTEISSLTTEYDSTKNIISKSIEKSFKRYDA